MWTHFALESCVCIFLSLHWINTLGLNPKSQVICTHYPTDQRVVINPQPLSLLHFLRVQHFHSSSLHSRYSRILLWHCTALEPATTVLGLFVFHPRINNSCKKCYLEPKAVQWNIHKLRNFQDLTRTVNILFQMLCSSCPLYFRYIIPNYTLSKLLVHWLCLVVVDRWLAFQVFFFFFSCWAVVALLPRLLYLHTYHK